MAGYDHTFELGGDKTVVATVNARHESSWYVAFTQSPGTRQKQTTKIDASLTFNSGHNWDLALWGKNLTNRTVLAAGGVGGIPGPAVGYLEAPRTYGLRLQVHY